MKNQTFERATGAPVTTMFFDHTARLGGGEISLYHMLITLDKTRFHPVVVLGEEGPLADKLRETDIEVRIIPLASSVSDVRKDTLGAASLLKIRSVFTALAYSLRLARFMTNRGAELVHTSSLKADLIGGIAARLARVPLIWHVRDRIDDDYLPPVVASAFRWLCRIIPNFVVGNSIATLETMRLPGDAGQAVVHSGCLTPKSNTAVVHEGVLGRAAAVKGSPDSMLVGLVGRITRWKGQHVFLSAAAQVLKKFPSARFQIIGAAMFGEEAYDREIRALTKSLGIEDSVEFMGFRNDVPALVDQLDVLVHASITGEPFGQVITEAMVAGKPVVATRGGGVPEIVQDGVTGFLVPMGDAAAMADSICKLLSDSVRASEMGTLARERVLRYFTVDVTTRCLESVFEKVLSEHGVAPLPPLPAGTPVLAP